MSHVQILFALCQCLILIYGWDIRNSNQDDVNLRHVSLYYLRAFLCVDASINSTSPTLVESTWPENILIIKPRAFPNINVHVSRDQSDCSKIHQAHSTDIDGSGYLWVLDVGSKNCPAKIVIYDLENKNNEVLRSTLVGHHGKKLSSIKVNPYTVGTIDHMAYVTMHNGHYLLAFFLHTKKWNEIFVSSGEDWPEDQVEPTDIAFTLDKRIYLTDKIGNLYVTDSMTTANTTELDVNHLGMLLDRPKGIITDQNGHLYYIIPRYGAVVRWNPTRTLDAEGHDVLGFHSGSIIQILFGVHGSVWIAVAEMSAKRDHCTRIMIHFSSNAII